MFGRRKDKNNAESASVSAEAVRSGAREQSPERDAALIAVITAAVAVYLGTSQNGIVIRSLRRSAPSTPKWGREGRAQQLYQQF